MGWCKTHWGNEVSTAPCTACQLEAQLQQVQERVEQLGAEGMGLQESITVVGEQLEEAIERAEAAEALAEQRGKALLAIKRSVSKGEMRRIAIQAAPAEAQAQQKEER